MYVDGTQNAVDTDNTGRFALTPADRNAGTLIVFRDGFTAFSARFDPLALELLAIVLTPAPIADSVTVTATPWSWPTAPGWC